MNIALMFYVVATTILSKMTRSVTVLMLFSIILNHWLDKEEIFREWCVPIHIVHTSAFCISSVQLELLPFVLHKWFRSGWESLYIFLNKTFHWTIVGLVNYVFIGEGICKNSLNACQYSLLVLCLQFVVNNRKMICRQSFQTLISIFIVCHRLSAWRKSFQSFMLWFALGQMSLHSSVIP